MVDGAQERNELKARARDEAAAQEARKNKVTITVDLLGRQVSHDDNTQQICGLGSCCLTVPFGDIVLN